MKLEEALTPSLENELSVLRYREEVKSISRAELEETLVKSLLLLQSKDRIIKYLTIKALNR